MESICWSSRKAFEVLVLERILFLLPWFFVLGPKKTWGRSILVKGKTRGGKMLLQTLERMSLNKLLTPRPSQESFIYSHRTRTCFLRKSLFVSLVVEHLFSPSQESLMCQHLLQRNCSLKQAKNFFLHQCSLKNCLFACNRSSWLLLRTFNKWWGHMCKNII